MVEVWSSHVETELSSDFAYGIQATSFLGMRVWDSA